VQTMCQRWQLASIAFKPLVSKNVFLGGGPLYKHMLKTSALLKFAAFLLLRQK
jgi:hypothetical protein